MSAAINPGEFKHSLFELLRSAELLVTQASDKPIVACGSPEQILDQCSKPLSERLQNTETDDLARELAQPILSCTKSIELADDLASGYDNHGGRTGAIEHSKLNPFYLASSLFSNLVRVDYSKIHSGKQADYRTLLGKSFELLRRLFAPLANHKLATDS